MDKAPRHLLKDHSSAERGVLRYARVDFSGYGDESEESGDIASYLRSSTLKPNRRFRKKLALQRWWLTSPMRGWLSNPLIEVSYEVE